MKGLAETSSFAETVTLVELYSKVEVRDVVEREVVVVDDDNTVTCFRGETKRFWGWLGWCILVQVLGLKSWLNF